MDNTNVMRWSLQPQWVTSNEVVHPPKAALPDHDSPVSDAVPDHLSLAVRCR
jgi:hypothetical protein